MSDVTDGADDFRTTLILLSCTQPDRLRMVLAREVAPGNDAASAGIRIAAGGSVRVLKAGRRTTVSSSKAEYDVGSIDVPADFLLGAGESIAVSAAEPSATDTATDTAASTAAAQPGDPAARLSTVGLGAALAKLLPTCGPAVARPQVDWPVAKP
jgi:hypothetical protein